MNKNITILLCLITFLGISSYTQSQSASDKKKDVTANSVLPERSKINKNWERGGRYENRKPEDELLHLRTKETKHFKNQDGTYTLITGVPQHYKDERGLWQDIDFTITKDNNAYRNITHEIKSYYPLLSGQGAVNINFEELNINVWKNPTLHVNKKEYKAKATEGAIISGKLLYDNIYPGMDEYFEVLQQGIENSILIRELKPVIASSSDKYISFSQDIDIPQGYTVYSDRKKENNNFSTYHLTIKGPEKSLLITPVIIFDSKIESNKAKNLAILKIKSLKGDYHKAINKEDLNLINNHIYVAKYRVEILGSLMRIFYDVPIEWLKNNNREYPVTIDPTYIPTISGTIQADAIIAPYDIYLNYSRSQILYMASELGSSNINISKIEFKSKGGGGASDVLNSSQQWMTDVNYNSFSSSGWDASVGTQVYNGNLTVSGSAGWVGPAFSTNFIHDGTKSIMFSFRHQDGSSEASYNGYEYANTSSKRLRWGGSNSTNPPNTSSYDHSVSCQITYTPACGDLICSGFENCSTCPTDCGICSTPGHAYGVYSPGALGGSVTECEIYAVGGTNTIPPSIPGNGYKVANPGDAGYSNVSISTFPVITSDNISCTNTNTTLATTATNPNWTSFGAGATLATPTAGTPKTTQYTNTGRKTVSMSADVPTYVTWTDDFETNKGWSFSTSGTSCTAIRGAITTHCDAQSCITGSPRSGSNVINLKNCADSRWSAASISLTIGTGGGTFSGYYKMGAENTSTSDYDNFRYAINGQTPTTGASPQTSDHSRITFGNCTNPSGWLSFSFSVPAGSQTIYLYFRTDANTRHNGSLVIIDDVQCTNVLGTTNQSFIYSGFNNILISSPSAGGITASAPTICPGVDAIFSSTLAGNSGYTYTWSVPSPPAGITANIVDPNASSTEISFTNTNPTNQTVTVNLAVSSECCGTLAPVLTQNITVYPTPANPTTTGNQSGCTGGSVNLTATGPAGSNFLWYDASTGGNYLGNGTVYTVSPITTGTTSYYTQTESSNGCLSSGRTKVDVVGTLYTTPTPNNATLCSPGIVTLSVNPVSGATYNWYSGSCGGTLEQSGPSNYFDANVSATTTYYCSVIVGSCTESDCTPVTATITTTEPSSATWNGSVDADWFRVANWTLSGSSCLPGCNTTVTIPNVTTKPVIGSSSFNPNGNPAKAGNITINSSSSLSFGDNKGILNLCGNLIVNGTINMVSGGVGVGQIVFNGTTQQNFSCTSSGTIDFAVVEVNNSAGLKVVDASGNKDFSVRTDGQLTLTNGVITTEGYRFIHIKNTASTAIVGQSTTSYINGRLKRNVAAGNNYDFPIGNQYAYQLMKIYIQSVSGGLSNISAVFDNISGNTGSPWPLGLPEGTYDALLKIGGTGASVDATDPGVWTITPDVGSAVYNLTLYGRNFSTTGNYYSILKRNTYPCAGNWGTDGTVVSGVYSGGPNLVTTVRTGLSGFSRFGIGRATNPLPVDLLRYNVSCYRNNIKINWTTASELNNDYFLIERSCFSVSEEYEVIGKIKGNGSTNTTHNYSFEYNEPENSGCYYRIVQVDYDGARNIITSPTFADCNKEYIFEILGINPNPSRNNFYVYFNSNNTAEITINIFDATGKIVKKELFQPLYGFNVIILNTETLSNGIYHFQMIKDSEIYNEKIIKSN
jgi:hypothetical protein